MRTGMQCPVCRGMHVDKEWSYGNGYFKCTDCGYMWK